jgi:hypothetical protein
MKTSAAKLRDDKILIPGVISNSSDSGLYPPMFAVVFTVAALGFVADRVFLHVMQHWLRWRD